MVATTDKKIELTAEQKAERYTPKKYVILIHLVFGGLVDEAGNIVESGIDLDPSSCASANQIVQAKRYFTKQQDGLRQSWAGANTIFLNPDYKKMLPWVNKITHYLDKGFCTSAILLANVCTDTAWFKQIAETRHKLHPLICFVEGRIKFNNPFGDSIKENGPEKPSMFVYWGNRKLLFDKLFSPIGCVVEL